MAQHIFENPLNNHRVTVGTAGPFFLCLLFGFFYFLFKGIYKHAIISVIVAICTVGIGWLVYPFFAPGIVRNYYIDKGFSDVTNQPPPTPEANKTEVQTGEDG